MPLSVEEAYVATRVDGHTTVAQIAAFIGKDAKETERILYRLADLGIITINAKGGTRPARETTPPPAADPYAGFDFPPALMREPTDLEEEVKKRVIYTYAQLSTWSLYELLKLERRVDAGLIKKAYFDRSKEWHPDRFRRYKQLGSFAKMIEGIYKHVNEAYKVLNDPERRKAYDSTLSYQPDPDEIEAILKSQIEQERQERRDEEKRQRRLRQNPILQRFDRAKDFYDSALSLEREGKLGEAMRAAQMATTYDERRPEYKLLYERLRDAAGEERVSPLLKRGKHFESMTHWDEAIEMYEEAVRIAPNNGDARVRLAYALLHAGRPISEVMPHAQRGAALASDDAEAHYILARCYEADNEKLAKRSYERAVELRPNYQEAKKRLKRLRWGF